MGNKRSRAARLSGGGVNAAKRWRRQLEIARQEHAARQMLAATHGRPTSARKLRALGLLMFVTCAAIGAGAAVVVARFFH